jgi:hypothetical protein
VDKSGSYSLSFYLIGVGICFSGLVISLILCYDKIKHTTSKNVDPASRILAVEAGSGSKNGSKTHLKKLVEGE